MQSGVEHRLQADSHGKVYGPGHPWPLTGKGETS